MTELHKLKLTQVEESWEDDLDNIYPVYGSDMAACFDLKADLKGRMIKIKGEEVSEIKIGISESVWLMPNERVLIPTGFVFHIPSGFRMNIMSRSGLSWKDGVVVLNAPAVIDEDYKEETFVMLHNTSKNPFVIEHGMRIAQAEINPVYRVELGSIGERDGGFGSSGLV